MVSDTIYWVKKSLRNSKEFWLVIAMLVTLLVLIIVILNYQPAISLTNDTNYFSELLQFKNETIAVILTAFGAWIGAGAAYFFGRESLREATDGMLEMKGLSPKERLSLMKVTDVDPRIVSKLWKEEDKLSEVCKQIESYVTWWFFIIVNESGKLETVINEEALWRFIAHEQASSKKKTVSGDQRGKLDFEQYNIKHVIDYIAPLKLNRKLSDIFVEIKKDYSVALVNELMEKKEVYLGIITDKNGKPTHYFTSANIRECLLKEEANGE